jgi:hypothetical protein
MSLEPREKTDDSSGKMGTLTEEVLLAEGVKADLLVATHLDLNNELLESML